MAENLRSDNENGLSSGRRLTKRRQDEDSVLVGDRGDVLPEPQLHTRPSSKACSVHLGVVDGSAHCAAMEAVEEIERHRKRPVDKWRGD